MTNDKAQPQRHTVASPNPRAEEGAPEVKAGGGTKATPVRPGAAVKASPLKGKRKPAAKKPRRRG